MKSIKRGNIDKTTSILHYKRFLRTENASSVFADKSRRLQFVHSV